MLTLLSLLAIARPFRYPLESKSIMGVGTALRTLASIVLVVAPLSAGLHLHPAKPFVDRAHAIRILSSGVVGGVASTAASQAARASGEDGAMVMHETNEWKFSAPASFKVSNKPLKTHLEEVGVLRRHGVLLSIGRLP